MRFNPSNTLRVCFPVGVDFSQPIPLPPIPCPDDLVGSTAAPQAAQTPVPQAIQCAKLSPAGVGAYPSPQFTYNVALLKPTQPNDTLVFTVTPTPPTITENGTPWGLNIAGGAFTAATIAAQETVRIAYPQTGSAPYASAELCEYPGLLIPDATAQLATGTSQMAVSNAINAAAGDLVIGYGWQVTSNYLSLQAGAGFALEPSGTSQFMEDQIVAAGASTTSSASWSGVVNWTQGIVALKSATPPIISSFFFNAQLFSCTVCTTAGQSSGDWTPLAAASVYQGAVITLYQVQNGNNSLICPATLNAQAIASCSNSAGVNVAPAFLTITYQIATPSGTVLVPVGSFSFTAPVSSLTSAVGRAVTLYLGFDSNTSAPRFGWVSTS